MSLRGAAVAVPALLACACASAPTPVTEPVAAPTGYLASVDVNRLADAVTPAPEPGSAVDQADRARSQALSELEGGDRWLMAIAHAELRPPLAAQHFDCAIGTRLYSASSPVLTRLMTRLQLDIGAAAAIARERNVRSRPAAVDPDRRVCLRLTEATRTASSYPSAAAAVAAAYGETFAALAPDRAAAARASGHEVAFSPAVCALNWPSDVEAGEDLGREAYTAAAATPAFQADLELARAEVAVARSTGLTNPGCAAERLVFSSSQP
ncbi:PA-phosphatase [uncultured Brevundimonas sp.]|uniref:PA-phosphatase n=1 Tax=uncultured Brevundimonas sp. TaxID=213418 RepID=UPI0030EE2FBB|tara:strand:- start:18043 stop:18843 length:801 start_codon:yes stop_codon:yes gene_type:complete